MRNRLFSAAAALLAAVTLLAGCDVPPPTQKLASPGPNKVYAVVDLSDQNLTVVRGLEDGEATEQHQFTVSTGIDRKRTPTGHFYPDFLSPDHVSSIYHVPMPWSVFFNGNIAIHGDPDTRLLGTPASNGCVRVAPDEAEIFYRMVEEVGLRNTRIVVRE